MSNLLDKNIIFFIYLRLASLFHVHVPGRFATRTGTMQDVISAAAARESTLELKPASQHSPSLFSFLLPWPFDLRCFQGGRLVLHLFHQTTYRCPTDQGELCPQATVLSRATASGSAAVIDNTVWQYAGFLSKSRKEMGGVII